MPRFAFALLPLAALAACAGPPLGPLVPVLPAPGKPYAQFRAEDDRCRFDANERVAGQAQYANSRAVGIGALTTVAGTALGAVVGGGRGAAVGAVTGGGLGIGLGAGSSAGAQGGIQAQYDAIYAQCMYSYGNQVPGTAPVVGYQPVPEAVPVVVPVPEPALIRSPLTRDIQRQLRRRGYYAGPTDGFNGPATTAAIQSFQATHGLAPDGVPSPYLLAVVRRTPPGA